MRRVELIANRSVEEDLMDAFSSVGVFKQYTKFPVVHGIGGSGPRMGDGVWPEENFVLVCYCDEVESRRIAEIVAGVKKRFPDEGVKLFVM
ncbi:MAG: PG0541 family transporter-associated protein [Treponemataceae bacterium]